MLGTVKDSQNTNHKALSHQLNNCFTNKLILVFSQYNTYYLLGMKYMIKPLEALCINFLLDYLENQNFDSAMFFTIFQFCVDCSIDKRLMEKCTTIVRSNWGELIWGEDEEVEESFLKISQKCLVCFLDVDLPYAQEIDLFDAVRFCFCFIICDQFVFFRPLHGQRRLATEIQLMVKRFAQN